MKTEQEIKELLRECEESWNPSVEDENSNNYGWIEALRWVLGRKIEG